LGKLADKKFVPDLVRMLSNQQIHSSMRQRVANALTPLLDDEKSVSDLAAILLQSDIADSIHNSLWTTSRRVGVRIQVKDGPTGKQLEIVKSSHRLA
jgi:hypothetical protein